MKKLPKVGVYLTAKEFDQLLKKYELLKQIIGKGEKLKGIRVEGRIGFHDLERLKK